MPAPSKQMALLQILARKRGMIASDGDKTVYRQWLGVRYGVDSATKLSAQELGDALDYLQGKPQGPNKWPGVRPADAYDPAECGCEALAARAAAEKQPMMRRIAWLAWELDKGPDYVNGMARKMFTVDRYDWCTCPQLHKITSALQYSFNRKSKGGAGH